MLKISDLVKRWPLMFEEKLDHKAWKDKISRKGEEGKKRKGVGRNEERGRKEAKGRLGEKGKNGGLQCRKQLHGGFLAFPLWFLHIRRAATKHLQVTKK